MLGPPAPPDMIVAASGSAIRLIARGRLGADEARALESALEHIAAADRSITVDLRAVTSVEPAAVEVLRRHTALARRTGSVLRVIGVPSAAHEPLGIVGA